MERGVVSKYGKLGGCGTGREFVNKKKKKDWLQDKSQPLTLNL